MGYYPFHLSYHSVYSIVLNMNTFLIIIIVITKPFDYHLQSTTKSFECVHTESCRKTFLCLNSFHCVKRLCQDILYLVFRNILLGSSFHGPFFNIISHWFSLRFLLLIVQPCRFMSSKYSGTLWQITYHGIFFFSCSEKYCSKNSILNWIMEP